MKETVYTISDWYDGARAGVADFHGQPRYYGCRWDDTKEDWSAHYLLTPLDADTFQSALNEWALWKRWQAAFAAGKTTQETHPTIPEDQPRHDELQKLLTHQLQIPADSTLKAKDKFDYNANIVEWTRVN